MDYRVLSLTLSLALFLGLWLLVSLRGVKNFSKKLYSAHILGVIGWTFGLILFYLSEQREAALFWAKFLYLSGISIASTFLHFSYSFETGHQNLSKRKLLAVYSPTIFLFFLFFFSPFILQDVKVSEGQNYFVYGPAHIIWDLVFFGTFLVAFVRFTIIYIKGKGVQRLRIKYILSGTYLALFLAGITNVIMPWFNQEYIWLGPCFAILWVSLIAYLIIRYRVLNINIMVRRGLVVLFVLGVLSIPYTFYIYLINLYVPNILLRSLLILAFAFVVIAVLVNLRVRSEITFGQLFSKERYKYRDSLSRLSEELVSKLDLQAILDETVDVLSQALVVKKVEIFIYSKEKLILKSSTDSNVKEKVFSYIPKSPLFPEGKILFKDEYTNGSEYSKIFNLLEAEVLIPIVYKDNFLALCVLGQRQMDYVYSSEDASAFKTFSNQIAIAIQNARSYQLIQELNLNLEQKVEERTKELKETQSQLLHSAKLASVGELAAGVAHELNNALDIAVLGNIRINKMLKKVQENPQLEWFLKETERGFGYLSEGLVRAQGVVKNLLTFSKKNSEGFQYQNIHEGLESSLKVLGNEMKNRVTVHKDFCEVNSVYCDLNQMNQVFLNILKNASDAIGEKGDIWVKTNKERENIVISIKDNGMGVAENLKDKIFDPFFTTKPIGKGTGLGLSVSYNIVRDHNGKIVCKSELGKGSEFIITLPIEPKQEKVIHERAS